MSEGNTFPVARPPAEGGEGVVLQRQLRDCVTSCVRCWGGWRIGWRCGSCARCATASRRCCVYGIARKRSG